MNPQEQSKASKARTEWRSLRKTTENKVQAFREYDVHAGAGTLRELERREQQIDDRILEMADKYAPFFEKQMEKLATTEEGEIDEVTQSAVENALISGIRTWVKQSERLERKVNRAEHTLDEFLSEDNLDDLVKSYALNFLLALKNLKQIGEDPEKPLTQRDIDAAKTLASNDMSTTVLKLYDEFATIFNGTYIKHALMIYRDPREFLEESRKKFDELIGTPLGQFFGEKGVKYAIIQRPANSEKFLKNAMEKFNELKQTPAGKFFGDRAVKCAALFRQKEPAEFLEDIMREYEGLVKEGWDPRKAKTYVFNKYVR